MVIALGSIGDTDQCISTASTPYQLSVRSSCPAASLAKLAGEMNRMVKNTINFLKYILFSCYIIN
jgi:hypothetical protein